MKEGRKKGRKTERRQRKKERKGCLTPIYAEQTETQQAQMKTAASCKRLQYSRHHVAHEYIKT